GYAEEAFFFAVWIRRDEAGSGSVAEEDGGVGVCVGDAAGHDLGGDDEDVAVAGGEVVGEGEGDEGACAGYGDVDGGCCGEAEFLGEDGGGAGEGAFGGATGEEDQADVLCGEIGVFQAGVGGGQAEACYCFVFGGVAAFEDAGGFFDGGGGAAGSLLKVGVGYGAGWEVVAEGLEVGHGGA